MNRNFLLKYNIFTKILAEIKAFAELKILNFFRGKIPRTPSENPYHDKHTQ